MYEIRDLQLMQSAIERYEFLLNRPYLYELSCLPTAPICPCKEPIYLLQITSLKDQKNYTYFSYILNALAAFNQTIGGIIHCKSGKLTLYLGIKGDHPAALSLLESGLQQTFPNTLFCQVHSPSDFLADLFDPCHYQYLSSALTIPNTTYTTPLLTSFTDLMGNHDDYVALFLAHPIRRDSIIKELNNFYEIYNILSDFSQTNYSSYKSDNKTVSNSEANCSTKNCNESVTNTCNESSSSSKNCYTNLSFSTPFTLVAHRATDRLSTTKTKNQPVIIPPQPSQNPKLNKPILPTKENDTPKNINATILFNKAEGSSSTNGSSTARVDGCSNSHSLTSTHSHSMAQTTYHSVSFSSPNKYIQETLIKLNAAITRHTTLSQNAAFCFSSYFFSPCADVSVRAAYSYLGLTNSSNILSPNIVSHWSNINPSYVSILGSLKQFSSPQFHINDELDCFANAIPILSTELLNSLYLPIT